MPLFVLTYVVLQLLYMYDFFFPANERYLQSSGTMLRTFMNFFFSVQNNSRYITDFISMLNFVEKLYNNLKLLYYAWMTIRC